MEHIVGIGEYSVSANTGDIIRTFSLASCVGLTIYCPIKRVAGMIHIVLPRPSSNEDAEIRPAYFASTGVPMMFRLMLENHKCQKDYLEVQMFGGAASPNKNDIFKVGEKNVSTVLEALEKLYLIPHKLDIGGNKSRTLSMAVDTGKIEITKYPILDYSQSGISTENYYNKYI